MRTLIFLTTAFFALTALSGGIHAEDREHKHPNVTIAPGPASLSEIVSMPAYKIYNDTTIECTEIVTGTNPRKAAREKKTVPKIDGDQIIKIQECMIKKGIDVNFNSHAASIKSGENTSPFMNPAQLAEIRALQEKMDREGHLKSPAPAEPVMVVVPETPPPAAPPTLTVLPEDYKPREAVSPAATGGGKPSNKYWVTP